MDEAVWHALLFDFYGPLLTEHQRQIFEWRQFHDLSLGEIAQQAGVSRQAVYDIVKRSISCLEEAEARLGLVRKHLRQQAELHEVSAVLERLAARLGASSDPQARKAGEELAAARRRLLAVLAGGELDGAAGG